MQLDGMCKNHFDRKHVIFTAHGQVYGIYGAYLQKILGGLGRQILVTALQLEEYQQCFSSSARKVFLHSRPILKFYI